MSGPIGSGTFHNNKASTNAREARKTNGYGGVHFDKDHEQEVYYNRKGGGRRQPLKQQHINGNGLAFPNPNQKAVQQQSPGKASYPSVAGNSLGRHPPNNDNRNLLLNKHAMDLIEHRNRRKESEANTGAPHWNLQINGVIDKTGKSLMGALPSIGGNNHHRLHNPNKETGYNSDASSGFNNQGQNQKHNRTSNKSKNVLMASYTKEQKPPQAEGNGYQGSHQQLVGQQKNLAEPKLSLGDGNGNFSSKHRDLRQNALNPQRSTQNNSKLMPHISNRIIQASESPTPNAAGNKGTKLLQSEMNGGSAYFYGGNVPTSVNSKPTQQPIQLPSANKYQHQAAFDRIQTTLDNAKLPNDQNKADKPYGYQNQNQQRRAQPQQQHARPSVASSQNPIGSFFQEDKVKKIKPDQQPSKALRQPSQTTLATNTISQSNQRASTILKESDSKNRLPPSINQQNMDSQQWSNQNEGRGRHQSLAVNQANNTYKNIKAKENQDHSHRQLRGTHQQQANMMQFNYQNMETKQWVGRNGMAQQNSDMAPQGMNLPHMALGPPGGILNRNSPHTFAQSQKLVSGPVSPLPNPKLYICYMNSVLQCLIATPGFSKEIINCNSLPLNKGSHYKGRISKTVKDFLVAYQNSCEEREANNIQQLDETLRKFQCGIGTNYDQFADEEEQDVHEFLSCLLGGLNEELNTGEKFNRPFDSQQSAREGEVEDALANFDTRARQLIERDQSQINNLFQFMIGDKIICQACDKAKTNFNSELILSIPVIKEIAPQAATDTRTRRQYNKSVNECLAQFFAPELLPDSERLHCSTCKQKTNVQKQTEIWTLPQCLVIHIKRFYFSERTMDYKKVDAQIEFEKSLSLQSRQKQRGKYELYGVVHHFGTKNGGHYVAEVRDLTNINSAPERESWYLCDDEMIRQIQEPELQSCSAYMLFYWRTSTAATAK